MIDKYELNTGIPIRMWVSCGTMGSVLSAPVVVSDLIKSPDSQNEARLFARLLFQVIGNGVVVITFWNLFGHIKMLDSSIGRIFLEAGHFIVRFQ